MKTITITTYNRPKYLRAALDSLRANEHAGYTLFVGMEPGCKEVENVIDAIDWIPKVVIKHSQRMLNKWNLKHTIAAAHAHGSDYNVILEDDVILSPDALDLSNWYFNLRENPYLSLGLFNYNSDPYYPNTVEETRYFTPLGWCFTAQIWKTILEPNWMCDARGWDWSISHLLKRNPELKTLHPRFARSNHIGRENGQHCTPAFHDKTFSHLIISDGTCRSYSLRKIPDSGSQTPLVTAVMITGKDASRAPLAQTAIRCFLEQTYPQKELLIINHGTKSVFIQDSSVRELRVSKHRAQNLGELKNIAFDYARGSLMLMWDDDDWYHPLRIETQVSSYRDGSAVLLNSQIRYSRCNQAGVAIKVPEGIHSTMLHPCGVPFRYASIEYGEDTEFLKNFAEVVVVNNDPQLYIRFYHGQNMSSARHVMGDYAEEQMRGRLDLTDDQELLLSRVLKNYNPAVLESDFYGC